MMIKDKLGVHLILTLMTNTVLEPDSSLHKYQGTKTMSCSNFINWLVAM